MNGHLKPLLAAAAILLLLAAPAGAQVPGIDLRLNPRIGLYEGLTDLTDVEDAGQRITTNLAGTLALGLAAELDIGAIPFGVRANLDYATGTDVRIVEGGIEETTSVQTTLLAVVGDVVFRPLPRVLIVSPYVFAGGGWKQYDFTVGGDRIGDLGREGDATLHFGGGLDVALGPLALNAEIGDYISQFEVLIEGVEDSEVQHDLFVTAGFSIGLF